MNRVQYTTTTVDVSYIIDCNHCGSHSEYDTYALLPAGWSCDDLLACRVDTEYAIRCPACRSRLNTSEHDFRAQVRVVHRV